MNRELSIVLIILFLLVVGWSYTMSCEGMGMYSGALSSWLMERTN